MCWMEFVFFLDGICVFFFVGFECLVKEIGRLFEKRKFWPRLCKSKSRWKSPLFDKTSKLIQCPYLKNEKTIYWNYMFIVKGRGRLFEKRKFWPRLCKSKSRWKSPLFDKTPIGAYYKSKAQPQPNRPIINYMIWK